MDQRGKTGTDWALKHDQYVTSWNERQWHLVDMNLTAGPQATDNYRAWYYLHGRRVIGNPMHQHDVGYVQCASSLNQAVSILLSYFALQDD